MSKTLPEALQALFRKAKVPSSPALAAQIIELAEDPSSTVEQFAELIKLDAALSARLLRLTNSAACAQRSPVTSIPRAVALLGINHVRSVALGFQLVSHLDRLGDCPFDMPRFWQQSVLRACLARELAQARLPGFVEEAFLVGLLQDCGIILLAQLFGAPYAALYARSDLSPLGFYELEKEQFEFDHVQAMVAMAKEWKLPDVITAPLAMHHTKTALTKDSSDEERFAGLTFLVGSVPLVEGAPPQTGNETLAAYARDDLGLDDDALASGHRRATEAYRDMTQLLGDMLPDNVDVSDLLSRAIAHLSTSVETELNESAEEQAQLKTALGAYRERAARDPLTGVLNRGALLDALRDQLQRLTETSEPLLVMFLDIDNFKMFNDTFGHKAGDAVLVGVSATLKQLVTNAGFVARYGGEEFVVVVPGLDERAARAYATGIVEAVRKTTFPDLRLSKPVTCSLGGVWGYGDVDKLAEERIDAADKLMYEAKRSGKNRACFASLEAEKPGRTNGSPCGARPRDLDGLCDDTKVDHPELERIAKRLNDTKTDGFFEGRKHPRKQMIARCRLTILRTSDFSLQSVYAVARNISTGGVAVLTGRALPKGQPVEIAILRSDHPVLYVAGVVAFCRHVEKKVHEIGLQLFARSEKPILSHDPISAIRELDWVAGAIRLLRKDADVEPACAKATSAS